MPRIYTGRSAAAVSQASGPPAQDAAFSPARPALEQLVGHDQPVDLVGALVDLGALRVAHQAFDPGLARIAARPEQLDRVRRDAHRGVRRGPFGDRGRLGDRLAAVPGRGGLPGHGTCGRDLAGHLGEHEAEALLLDKRSAKGLPLLQVSSGCLQPGPGDPDARRGDRDPALAERRQRDLVALALPAETVRDRDLGTIEHELRRRAGADPHLPLVRPEPEAGRSPSRRGTP